MEMDCLSGFLLIFTVNANETSIARGQNSLACSLAHLLDHSILVNAALMALTHGVYTVFLVNAADQCRRRLPLLPW